MARSTIRQKIEAVNQVFGTTFESVFWPNDVQGSIYATDALFRALDLGIAHKEIGKAVQSGVIYAEEMLFLHLKRGVFRKEHES